MLYRVATVTVFGRPEDPRINWTVRLLSDLVVLGGRPIAKGREPILLPLSSDPRAWLLEALEQLPNR